MHLRTGLDLNVWLLIRYGRESLGGFRVELPNELQVAIFVYVVFMQVRKA